MDYTSTSALVRNGGSITDHAANNATLTLASPGASGSLGNYSAFIIDTTAPTVSITSSTSSSTNTSPIPFTIDLNESSPNFDANDVTITNGTIHDSNWETATQLIINVTPNSEGAVTVRVAENIVDDTA